MATTTRKSPPKAGLLERWARFSHRRRWQVVGVWVLILVGLSVVYAGRIGKSRWGERRWFQRLFNERTIRIMPVVGAALVIAIGLFFCATSGIAAK